jgi:hypothetical protein
MACVMAAVARDDPGVGCPVRPDRRDHRVDVAQRGEEDLDVRSGQILPYDVDVRRHSLGLQLQVSR